jgi:hypothetical protein
MSFNNSASNIQKWIGISLINLSIVALLGFTLRSKILFNIPFLDFKHVLHAHSHFAFGGWVSLALFVLLSTELLQGIDTRMNQVLLLVNINAWGMLISFLLQGYGLFSIIFSTLFIFVSYYYTWVFLKALRKADVEPVIKQTAIWALIYMSLSSIGPYTLAYLLAVESGNVILYKDAVYTYLHLQYNGFFTLAILALLFNKIIKHSLLADKHNAKRFLTMVNATVIPSLFLCYLWHYPTTYVRIVAVTGSILLILSVILFLPLTKNIKAFTGKETTPYRVLLALSIVALILKLTLQSLTIFPTIGDQVFNNRPVIIGFLHLVLLGFVTLYLLAHFLQLGYLGNTKLTSVSLAIFVTGVLANELLLMTQGLEIMFMTNSGLFPQILWYVAIVLVMGGILIVASHLKTQYSKYNATFH